MRLVTLLKKLKMQEWLEHHYTTIHWEELPGEAETALFGYLLKKRKSVYRIRCLWQETWCPASFRRNHAEKVIKTVVQPIFIAHC